MFVLCNISIILFMNQVKVLVVQFYDRFMQWLPMREIFNISQLLLTVTVHGPPDFVLVMDPLILFVCVFCTIKIVFSIARVSPSLLSLALACMLIDR